MIGFLNPSIILEERRSKMAKFSNDLCDAELERLAILAEECGEVQQMVGKIIRHGYYSYHPSDVTQRKNKDYLIDEIGDILWIVLLMIEKNDINISDLVKRMNHKEEKSKKYLHHQG